MEAKNMKAACPVLIVDDDPDLCGNLVAALGKTCQVHVEHDLSGSENYLTHERPQVILLDNNLPDGMGVASIRHILELHPQVRIVLMTADVSSGLRERAIEAGAIKLMEKPFRMSEINDIIATL